MNVMRQNFYHNARWIGHNGPHCKDMDLKVGDRVYVLRTSTCLPIDWSTDKETHKLYGTIIWKHPTHHFCRVKFDCGFIESHSTLNDDYITIHKVV